MADSDDDDRTADRGARRGPDVTPFWTGIVQAAVDVAVLLLFGIVKALAEGLVRALRGGRRPAPRAVDTEPVHRDVPVATRRETVEEPAAPADRPPA